MSTCSEYSTILKLYKPQLVAALPIEEEKYSIILKLYKPQRAAIKHEGGDNIASFSNSTSPSLNEDPVKPDPI